nr:hypothetical protein [Chloroflexota bacterium]
MFERRVEDTDTEISGQVVDANTRKGIPDALVIALRPDVRVQDFLRQQLDPIPLQRE